MIFPMILPNVWEMWLRKKGHELKCNDKNKINKVQIKVKNKIGIETMKLFWNFYKRGGCDIYLFTRLYYK